MVLALIGGIVATSIEARIARGERSLAQAQAKAAQASRLAANGERLRAENQAAEANRQRENAERRLGELRTLADGAVRAYLDLRRQDASAAMASSVRDSLIALGREDKLAPGMEALLEQTTATVHSLELASDPRWEVPTGWSAVETAGKEYRVGLDRQMRHNGVPSLFLRSLAGKPSGRLIVRRRFAGQAYAGRRVRLTAYLRRESVSHQAVFTVLTFTEGPHIEVAGTSGWLRHGFVVDVPPGAQWVQAEFRLEGAGTLWVSDVRLDRVSTALPLTLQAPANLDFQGIQSEGEK
jgi:hypothetical protein